MKAENRRDTLPKAIIIDGLVVISVGVDYLKHQAENMNTTYRGFDEETKDDLSLVVTDVDVFASHVVDELNRQEEDGTTPIHQMLDKAYDEALEQGAEGVKIDGEPTG